jgi:hypothetical protein
MKLSQHNNTLIDILNLEAVNAEQAVREANVKATERVQQFDII